MAESMTYSSLIADVATYAERSDQPFLSQIPRFIMLAEQRIASKVRGLGLLKIVTGSLTAGLEVLAKPEHWRETATFMLRKPTGEAHFLKQRGYSFCRAYSPSQSATGLPLYYSDYGYEHFLIALRPDLPYDFELAYYERPQPLDSSNQVNWTTQYAPQLLLYATLMEAQPFLKLGQRTVEFQALFETAANDLFEESQRRLNGDQTLIRTGAK